VDGRTIESATVATGSACGGGGGCGVACGASPPAGWRDSGDAGVGDGDRDE